MPNNPPVPLSVAQAATRAQWMIESGHKLSQAAADVSEARGDGARSAAEAHKEEQLLSYRVITIPDALMPVLETLMQAAEQSRGN